MRGRRHRRALGRELRARPDHRRAGGPVGLAGTALGDLFVFGDIRDAVREGTRLATGQQADELMLGLGLRRARGHGGNLCDVGVGGAGAGGADGGQGGAQDRPDRRPAWRPGSAARVREVVDWAALQRAVGVPASPSPRPRCAAAREAVKVEKARDLVRLVGDVGPRAGHGRHAGGARWTEARRGTARHVADRAARRRQGRQDPRDPQARRPRRHRAHGRRVQSGDWMFWALVTAFGLVSSLKRMTERSTERYCVRRRRRRVRERQAREQAGRREDEQGAVSPTAEAPTVIAFPAPALAPERSPTAADPIVSIAIPFPRAASGGASELIASCHFASRSQQPAFAPSERHAALFP